MKKYQVGILGFGQMHITTMVESFLAMPETFEFMGFADTKIDLVSICDQPSTRPAVRSKVLEKCGPLKEYDTVEALLEEKPDLVLVAAENSFHCEICCAALKRCVHVIVEKPMCMTYNEAAMMCNAAKKNNALLIVNWPTAWFPAFRLVGELAHSGIIGGLQRFSYTNGESLGPFSYGQTMTEEEMLHEWWYHKRYGGGGVMDYIGYGCNLSRWMLGEKATGAFCMATNIRAQFADIEDHATVVLKFPHARALVEGTWATVTAGNVPTGPIVYGETGTLIADRWTGTVHHYTERHQKNPTQIFEAKPIVEGIEEMIEDIQYDEEP